MEEISCPAKVSCEGCPKLAAFLVPQNLENKIVGDNDMASGAVFSQGEEVRSIPERPLKLETNGNNVLAAAQDKFVQSNPRSLKLHQKALKSLPGGNTRTLLHTAPFPLCMKSGKGYQVTDEDGHT